VPSGGKPSLLAGSDALWAEDSQALAGSLLGSQPWPVPWDTASVPTAEDLRLFYLSQLSGSSCNDGMTGDMYQQLEALRQQGVNSITDISCLVTEPPPQRSTLAAFDSGSSPLVSGGPRRGKKGASGTQDASKIEASNLGSRPSDYTERLTQDQVVQMSRTQAGSKLLQRKLLKGHPNVINDILSGLEVELPSLMCDTYGNYLCSAAFQACSVAQRQRFMEIVSRCFCAVATDKWGTHALQALIGLICTSTEQTTLLLAVRVHVVELSCDANGVHVVQRALVSVGGPLADIILEEAMAHIETLADNQYGLCVLKKAISQSQSRVICSSLLREMARASIGLVQRPYGNYAVQHVLEEWGGDACSSIYEALRGRLVQLSTQKFSSNVVEHMLRSASPEMLGCMLQELTSSPDVLMSTVYGHYVARCALQRSGGLEDMVKRAIGMGVASMRSRRLRARWERFIAEEA
jgi:hypothetical protein